MPVVCLFSALIPISKILLDIEYKLIGSSFSHFSPLENRVVILPSVRSTILPSVRSTILPCVRSTILPCVRSQSYQV